jgi:MEDS: MEthanogen/methylotroph, DcmR Sensory domain
LKLVSPLPAQNLRIRHQVQFYADDAAFADGFARVIENVLRVSNVAIVIATELHRAQLLSRLRVADVGVDDAIKEGRYVALDVVGILSAFMDDEMPDPVRCASLVSDLVIEAEKQARIRPARIAICGECAPTLLATGNAEGAIRLEHVWNQVTMNHNADTLCGYVWRSFPHKTDNSIFQRICAEHSAVHGRELAY